MSRFGTLDTRYLDAAGNPLGGGKIYFYESGTSTAKTTYTTSDQTVANPQPFVLDAGGAQGGGIFFTGQARTELRDSLGVLVTELDPVGSADTSSGFGDWDAGTTYDINDLVKGSDNLYYISVINVNVNHNPATPSPIYWMRVRFLDDYNAAYFYSTNDVVLSGGILWISLSGSNQNNTPGGADLVGAAVKWRSLAAEFFCDNNVKTANFAAVNGRHYLVSTTSGAITMTLPASPVLGDKIYITDWNGTFLTNNLTLARNGKLIYGTAADCQLNIARWSGALMYTYLIGWQFV
jgi:hypothetical protein|tara:strand:- start:2129 stop:3007 length:879 start_codon:yes stop_codon:yes gene_type:complete